MNRRDSQLLSTGEVARLLGSSRQHVVDLCERGRLRYVRAGSHRRIPRVEVERLLGAVHDVELMRDQERSLWLHWALLSHLAADPEGVLSKARANLAHLQHVHRPPGATAGWLHRWEEVLDGGVDAVAEVLTSRDPLAIELRQNSPFAGAISQQTRSEVLAAFARHWRREHAGRRRQPTLRMETSPDGPPRPAGGRPRSQFLAAT